MLARLSCGYASSTDDLRGVMDEPAATINSPARARRQPTRHALDVIEAARHGSALDGLSRASVRDAFHVSHFTNDSAHAGNGKKAQPNLIPRGIPAN